MNENLGNIHITTQSLRFSVEFNAISGFGGAFLYVFVWKVKAMAGELKQFAALSFRLVICEALGLASISR